VLVSVPAVSVQFESGGLHIGKCGEV